MYEDEYHPELSEIDIEDFDEDYADDADDVFEDGVEAFFFDEDFGAPLTAAQRQAQKAAADAAYMAPAAVAARAERAAQAQQGLTTGLQALGTFTPLIQQVAAADQARRAENRARQEAERIRRSAPRQQAPPRQGPQGRQAPPRYAPQRPPPPGYHRNQQQMQMQMQRKEEADRHAASLREKDKKLMLYILGGTAVVVAGIGIYALASGKK